MIPTSDAEPTKEKEFLQLVLSSIKSDERFMQCFYDDRVERAQALARATVRIKGLDLC